MQARIAESVAKHSHTSAHSGQKTGKSLMAVVLGLWWAETRVNANVIFTSTTDEQVKGILWRELRVRLREADERCQLEAAARAGLRRELEALSDAQVHDETDESPESAVLHGDARKARRVEILEKLIGYSELEEKLLADCARFLPPPEPPRDPRVGLESPISGNLISGRVSGTTEGTAGFSGENLLIIADEASGIENEFFAVFEGNTAGGGRQLLLGNPTQTSGIFYDTQRGGLWNFFRLSSWDTPQDIPGLAKREWCQQRLDDWGHDDPRYQIRVLGRPPLHSAQAVCSLSSIEAAKARWPMSVPNGPLHIGVDVARFGDDASVTICVRGDRAEVPRSTNGFDAVQVASMVLGLIEEQKGVGESCLVTIDVGGGYGGGVLDVLTRMLAGNPRPDIRDVQVRGFNGSSTEVSDLQYPIARDEAWFGVERWMVQGGAIPPNEKLESDLLAPHYDFDLKGRRKVEPKKDVKKRLGRSPDFGDALALAVYRRANKAPQNFDDQNFEDRWSSFGGRGFG